jgi:hypothetical protein
MSNQIQIKRSVANAVVTGLANGELAYTQNSNILYIGAPDGSGSIAIGGQRNPGTLTANQALVANSTSGIDKVIVANLSPTQIYANGSFGNVGYVLVSGNSGNVAWVDPATITTVAAGSNTQVQFNQNGGFGANANLTYDYVTSTLSATNISGNGANITSVDAVTVGGNSASDLRTYADNKAANAYSNAISYADDKAANAYSNAISYAANAAANAYSNATSYADNQAANAYSNATAYADNKAANAYSNATSYADDKAANAYSNATSYADNAAANAYSNATSYADNAAANAYSNATSYADNAAANAYSNAMSDTLSRSATYTGNNTFSGTNTVFNSNLSISSANISAPSAVLNIKDIVASGNLTVSGTLTTINTSILEVSDPMIKLADHQANSDTYTDVVDVGFYAEYGNTANTYYTGFFRDHAVSTTEYSIFKLFHTHTEPGSTVNTGDATYKSGKLVAWLGTPSTGSEGFQSNSTLITLTANSTQAVQIAANTLSLSTALPATSGGTGLASYTAGDILYASNTSSLSALGIAANGQVLQVVNNIPAWGVLDGGTF